MPFWENMPYTNFHGTNQDWIIETMKKLVQEWADYGDNLQQAYDAFTASVDKKIADLNGDWTDYKNEMNTAFSDLHDYVYNYFDNLDVQDEIDHKLDEMTAQGLWDDILHSFFDSYSAEIDQKVAEQDAKLADQDDQIEDQTQRIDVMRAEMDAFMQSHGTVSATLRQVNHLWTGSATTSDPITLNGLLSDYDRIEVRVTAWGQNSLQIFKPSDFFTTAGASFRTTNQSNGELSPAILSAVEVNIKAADHEEGVEVTNDVVTTTFNWWRWHGSVDDEGFQSLGNSSLRLREINGIKYTDISAEKDPELTDIRVGADGTVYPTAGDAVRDQIEDTNDKLSDLKDELFTQYTSKNKYDGTVIPNGYVIPENGNIGEAPSYSHTDFINISDHGNSNIVLSCNYNFANGAVRYALYDAQQNYITGYLIAPADVQSDATLQRHYYVIQCNQTAKFIRFSSTTNFFNQTNCLFMIEYGDAPTEYEIYYNDDRFNDQLLEDSVLASMTYGKTPHSQLKESFNDGETITVSTNSIMKNQTIEFFSKITSFDTLWVGHGPGAYGYYIKIDNTNVTYGTNNSDGVAIPHNLTINEYIHVIISIDVDLNIKYVINTAGGSFTRTQQINSTWSGSVFAKNVNSILTDCILTWDSVDYKKPLWCFGDSYFTIYSNTRWTNYVFQQWGYDNALLNAYPGENSVTAYRDLLDALKHGKPKYLFWTMGMNDADSQTAINQNWLNTLNSVKTICQLYNIELILYVCPPVTAAGYNNNFKNPYVINSGYRYIDMSKAVENVSGWLSEDNVHPSEIGGRVMASYITSTLPELLQGD